QRIHRVAMDVTGADPMHAPAPVEYSGAVFDEVYRSGDIGGDAGIRAAIDNHIEAWPNFIQPAQKAVAATIAPARCENASDGGAVAICGCGVAAIHAGAAGVTAAVTEIIGEVRR